MTTLNLALLDPLELPDIVNRKRLAEAFDFGRCCAFINWWQRAFVLSRFGNLGLIKFKEEIRQECIRRPRSFTARRSKLSDEYRKSFVLFENFAESDAFPARQERMMQSQWKENRLRQESEGLVESASLRDIFHEALQLESEAERLRYLMKLPADSWD